MTKILLTKEEVEFAAHIGMSHLDYAREKHALQMADEQHKAWLQTPEGVKYMERKIADHERYKAKRAAQMKAYRAKKK